MAVVPMLRYTSVLVGCGAGWSNRGRGGSSHHLGIVGGALDNVSPVWPLAPRLQTLEAFALSGSRYQLLGAWHAAESARVAPFEELELQLATLWAR